ncbi:MAG: GNAT family N-acetyltransferase [Candidatus Saccharibacteria bacterium]
MLNLRTATAEDASIIHGFVCDLADYEHARDRVELSVEDYAAYLREGNHFNAVIAETDGTPAGMAIWYTRFSTWVGDYMHLEDAYVDPEVRAQGIGTKLIRHLATTALDLGMKRMEWLVLDWNESAIRTYRNMGALILPEWQLCQMDEQALREFTASEPGTL